MQKLIEMRFALMALLKTVHSNIYYDVAPDDAIKPFVVLSIPNSIDSGTLENFVLDIDIWDDDKDTTVLETLANNIDESLQKKVIFINDKLGFVIYRNNRLNVTDEDPRIRRRKYVYQARTYQKYY